MSRHCTWETSSTECTVNGTAHNKLVYCEVEFFVAIPKNWQNLIALYIIMKCENHVVNAKCRVSYYIYVKNEHFPHIIRQIRVWSTTLENLKVIACIVWGLGTVPVTLF